jgi:hypothetical protein
MGLSARRLIWQRACKASPDLLDTSSRLAQSIRARSGWEVISRLATLTHPAVAGDARKIEPAAGEASHRKTSSCPEAVGKLTAPASPASSLLNCSLQ